MVVILARKETYMDVAIAIGLAAIVLAAAAAAAAVGIAIPSSLFQSTEQSVFFVLVIITISYRYSK